MAGQVVRCELGREVVRLAGQDHGAVALPDHERLVPVGVPGRGENPDPGQDLHLAVDLLVGRAGEVDE